MFCPHPFRITLRYNYDIVKVRVRINLMEGINSVYHIFDTFYSLNNPVMHTVFNI